MAFAIASIYSPDARHRLIEGPLRSGKPRGRPGFDGGVKPEVRVEGAAFLVNPAANKLVANDDNYALAA